MKAAYYHKKQLPKTHTYLHVCQTRTYTYAGIISILISRAHGPVASDVVRGACPDRLEILYPPRCRSGPFLRPQHEYRRNKINRDSISSDCNRGDLYPGRHHDAVFDGPPNSGKVCLGHCFWSASWSLHDCGLRSKEISPSSGARGSCAQPHLEGLINWFPTGHRRRSSYAQARSPIPQR